MAVGTTYKNSGRSTENCRLHPDGVRCPFCGSFDTKFKFLNNHKVDQPRYQCSNCKQFWTEGGRIRGTRMGTEEVQIPVAAHTTDTTHSAGTPSQPSVYAVSTPTPTASNGSGSGGVSNTSLWNALLEVAKRYRETDFPDLD